MTRMYRCSGTVEFHAAVEADSLAEAERIIDGILENVSDVTIREDGGLDEGGDELNCSAGSVRRGTIRVET